MKPLNEFQPSIQDDGDCQPINEPLEPLHYVAPLKPEWVVDGTGLIRAF